MADKMYTVQHNTDLSVAKVSTEQLYFVDVVQYIGRSDVAVMYGHSTISMLGGDMAYCVKLSGEDLSPVIKV